MCATFAHHTALGRFGDEFASPNGLETMGGACDDASAWEAVVEEVLVRIKVLKMNMMSVLVH